MKLTDEQINQAAAELLGIEWQKYDNYGIRNPDFIHDANAVRELVVWLRDNGEPLNRGMFTEFVNGECAVWSLSGVLALPPRTITLAVLYAVGKITLEQAREAMEGDSDE